MIFDKINNNYNTQLSGKVVPENGKNNLNHFDWIWKSNNRVNK